MIALCLFASPVRSLSLVLNVSKIAWKNIYSGIFRDLDEILLPMEIAEEDGRLPLKRGPKALQEKGICKFQKCCKNFFLNN